MLDMMFGSTSRAPEDQLVLFRRLPAAERAEELKRTRDFVVERLQTRGCHIFPAVPVLWRGALVPEAVLDDAMAFVMGERQSAARAGRPFDDPLAVLLRHLPSLMSRQSQSIPGGFEDNLPMRSSSSQMEAREGMPRNALRAPLILDNEEAA
ncbi:hypothetical protein ROTAS13_03871 [Roseomonas sp. TAS13]|uniref:hypothetical protein n=1 Tax=Roseomonas sp. TAS13 TaxID=1926319 RepID=UPI00095CB430|nr:hypothetical protein [Roseomonas sp. TAS13]GAV36184.1 hypothetical protein ROTAS13_03871 [Roseomonas sp. TAS13]